MGKKKQGGYVYADPLNYDLLKNFARENKRNATLAEEVLWTHLKKSMFGVRFRRQYIISNYIADFVCLPLKLVIEVDGEYHQVGNMPAKDQLRTDNLADMGFHVLRFTNECVLFDTENVLTTIQQSINDLANERK